MSESFIHKQCPPSKSCEGKRYFNIYYPDPTSTDKAIYSGNNTIDLLYRDGEAPAQEYIATKIAQKMNNENDMVLSTENSYSEQRESFKSPDQKFWTEDLMELVDCKTIHDFVPDKDDSLENYLNAMVRGSILIGILLMFLTGQTSFILLIIGVMVSTVFMYENEIIKKANAQTEEESESTVGSEEGFVDVPNNVELRNDQEASCETDDSCLEFGKKEGFLDGLDRRQQNMFKTLSEITGEEIADRNTIKLDPMHIPNKPFEAFLFGGAPKRKLYI